MRSRVIHVELLIAVVFIFTAAAVISMQCWPAQIGCHQPSVVGWLNFLNLVLTISLGPLAPIYMVAVFEPNRFLEWTRSSVIFVTSCNLIASVPWLIYAWRRSYVALSVASVVWVFFGFMFGVAAFT
jgi:hypothetical protein